MVRPTSERRSRNARACGALSTPKQQPPQQLAVRHDPTVPAPPHAERGSCNPDDDSLKSMVASAPKPAVSLETKSVKSLRARVMAGTLTAQGLTRA